jgi:predicted transcriptional regulator
MQLNAVPQRGSLRRHNQEMKLESSEPVEFCSISSFSYTESSSRDVAMAKPEDKATLDHVLKLIHQLSPTEQEQQVQEIIKLQELRSELMTGVEQIERGEIVSGEQVFRNLREHYPKRMTERK